MLIRGGLIGARQGPGLGWAETLSVGNEGGHLQEGTIVLGTGGQPETERV